MKREGKREVRERDKEGKGGKERSKRKGQG